MYMCGSIGSHAFALVCWSVGSKCWMLCITVSRVVRHPASSTLKHVGVCNVILIYFNVDIITKSASVGF